jgi:hypothetical protein
MSEETGTKAIEALDGFDHMGRNLKVSPGNPREEKWTYIKYQGF